MEKENKIIITFIVLLVVLFFLATHHTFIHAKYYYQKLTKTSTKHFTVTDFNIRPEGNEVYDEDFELKEYINNNQNIVQEIDSSIWNEKVHIFIQVALYDSIEDIKVYLNNKKIKSDINKEYYSIFNDFYIVQTDRIFLYKENLDQGTNKIDYVVGKDIFTYYFKVKK